MNDTLDLPPIEAPAMPVATQPAAPEPGTLKAREEEAARLEALGLARKLGAPEGVVADRIGVDRLVGAAVLGDEAAHVADRHHALRRDGGAEG